MPNMQAIAATVVLPLTHASRFAVGYGTAATVTARPFTIQTVNVTANPAASVYPPYILGGSYLCAISRDPLTAICEIVNVNPATSWGYYFYHSVPRNSTNSTCEIQLTDYVSDLNSRPLQWVYKRDAYEGSLSTEHPFGVVSFCRTLRSDSAIRLAYFDRGTKVNFEFCSDQAGTVPVATSGDIEVLRFNQVDVASVYSVPYTARTNQFYPITDSGYYTFILHPSTPADSCYIKVSHFSDGINAPSQLVSHRPIPGIVDRMSINAIKINGASLMFTPDCAEMAVGGMAAGVQLVDSYMLESFITTLENKPATESLTTLRDVKVQGFKHGFYGWHRPLTRDSFTFTRPLRYNIDYTVSADTASATLGGLSNYVSYMDVPDGWMVMAFNTPASVVTGTGYPGGLFHVTAAWSVEFATNDIWFDPRPPSMLRTSQLNDFLEVALARIPQFTENDVHVDELLSWIRAEARTFGQAMGLVLKRFSPLIQRGVTGALRFAEDFAEALQ